jgi:hypothetical protein
MWLIILRDLDDELKTWGLERKDTPGLFYAALAVGVDNKRESIATDFEKIKRCLMGGARLVVLGTNTKGLVADAIEKVRNSRIWVHFGGQQLSEFTPNTILQQSREQDIPTENNEIWPMSFRDKTKWVQLLENAADRLRQREWGPEIWEELNRELEHASDLARLYYFKTRAMEQILNDLFPLYIDLRGLGSCARDRIEQYETEAKSDFGVFISSRPPDDDYGRWIEYGTGLNADLKKRLVPIWEALRTWSAQAHLSTATNRLDEFCSWFEGVSKEYTAIQESGRT